MPTILLIDDETSIIEVMGDSLVKAGYEVLPAENGEKGLQLLEKEAVDAVVTDIIMPEKEGLETIIEIRRKQPELPIIAISGGGRTRQLHFLEISRDFGANDVLQKPFKPSQLIASLHSLLATQRDLPSA
ncbi:response regulator [Fodinicurvata fenggangensis]|uniref:response regulator n=1 Tax=Fodinicurvata fenggangensis TaxID=1121830 RepID=UPI00047EED13|nr:response regulator [Fodinicurvata fenggangensis]